jgi:hypothetical protein
MEHGVWSMGYEAKGIECGLRPVGDIGAYAPEGIRNGEGGNIGQRKLRAEFGILTSDI